MTQFKDKSSAFGRMSINTGLFTYPVLMAADILLYDAKIVPVGEDQLQHLELTRALARKFNSRFGRVFTEPKAVLTNVPRLMSLKNPLKKMSKSDPQGCLFLDDDPVLIRKKIMQAVTDSFNTIAYDPERRPGISNLITMYSAMSEMDKNAVVKKFTGLGYATFKQELAELLIEKLAPFREAKAKLLLRSKETLAAFLDGSKKANKAAEQKMKKIRNVLGLLSS
jgi:tryptophanyl-tRNA synthetase